MRSRALAIFLALVMAWMGLSAQEQAAEICFETLAEQIQAGHGGTAQPSTGTLDDHHLDNLPFQVLADLIGLLGGQPRIVAGLGVRPDASTPRGSRPPDPAPLHRPPIARG